MENLLFTIAIILLIVWAIGFVVFNTGGFIHLLLVISLIVIIIRVVQRKKVL